MRKLRQVFSCAAYDFRQWRRNPRVFLTFALGFILCFLLSDKAVQFARSHDTPLQIVEAFVWTFGDANNILIASLLLVLLFADMPFVTNATPFFLMRTSRKAWLAGQILYVFSATALYLVFILVATCILCARDSFPGNQWSETAAMLGFSGVGSKIALPAFVKTMQMSRPYDCMAAIFLLMLLYTLLMVSLMLALNLRGGPLHALVGAVVFSLYGFILNPEIFMKALDLPPELTYKANVLTGWFSPLNQATYHMHNFGYDLLPRIWQSCLIFAGATALLLFAALRAMKKYNFQFTGTQE